LIARSFLSPFNCPTSTYCQIEKNLPLFFTETQRKNDTSAHFSYFCCERLIISAFYRSLVHFWFFLVALHILFRGYFSRPWEFMPCFSDRPPRSLSRFHMAFRQNVHRCLIEKHIGVTRHAFPGPRIPQSGLKTLERILKCKT